TPTLGQIYPVASQISARLKLQPQHGFAVYRLHPFLVLIAAHQVTEVRQFHAFASDIVSTPWSHRCKRNAETVYPANNADLRHIRCLRQKSTQNRRAREVLPHRTHHQRARENCSAASASAPD